MGDAGEEQGKVGEGVEIEAVKLREYSEGRGEVSVCG